MKRRIKITPDGPRVPTTAERAAATRRANAIKRAERALALYAAWIQRAARAARRVATLRARVAAAVRAGFLPATVLDGSPSRSKRRKRASAAA